MNPMPSIGLTLKPVTATWSPDPTVGVNAAYEVSPMNGGMAVQLSIVNGMSFRGNVTFTM